MRLLVNGLSIGSLSGQHVVYGFLRPLTRWIEGKHELLLMTYESESPPQDLLGGSVRWLPIRDGLRPWWKRAAWEIVELRKVIRREAVDLVLNTSGASIPACPVPQATLAQNPWCFVGAAHRGLGQRFKAGLQRRAYRRALGQSVVMIYISAYLRGLYEGLSSRRPAHSEVAHVGLDDETHRAAAELQSSVDREPLSVVSVSAMAPWKGIETVIEALRLVRQNGLGARLTLVGPWPDPDYEAAIRRQIRDARLDEAVTIVGHVTKDELHRYYARSKVFCLMSHCESYGIPAAEAQAFGTPVVASEGCAIPEICAGGGRFGPAGDAAWTAQALTTLLSDDTAWRAASAAAVRNAQRLKWETTARPLMRLFSVA